MKLNFNPCNVLHNFFFDCFVGLYMFAAALNPTHRACLPSFVDNQYS